VKGQSDSRMSTLGVVCYCQQSIEHLQLIEYLGGAMWVSSGNQDSQRPYTLQD
jgi:hypothetical protein